MFQAIVLMVLSLNIQKTVQIIYDDDLDRAYPSPIIYIPTYPSSDIKYLKFTNNCSCKQFGSQELQCVGPPCVSLPDYSIDISEYRSFKLKLSVIEILKINDLNIWSNLTNIEFNTNVKLRKITPGIFHSMVNLKNISLIGNTNLNYLDDNVFEGLITVQQMMFQKNGFNNVIDITKALSVTFLPQLTFLDISESLFHDIHDYEFNPMNGTRLEQLNLILCELETIGENTLKPLRNLHILRLGQNIFNITSLTKLIWKSVELNIPLRHLNLYDIGLSRMIPKELMQAIGASNISYLSLASNHFDNLLDDSFPEMPNLLELDLRNNYIVGLSNNTFNKLTSLKKLHMGENKLSTIEEGLMIPYLTFLDIAGNSLDGFIFSIQDQVFKRMSKLKNLQLAYNNIVCLQAMNLFGLYSLTRLNLRSASIMHIQKKAFTHLSNLTLLNLMYNEFTRLSVYPLIFEGLNSLKVLLLGGCPIYNLTMFPTIFACLPNLRYLGLEKTGLHTIMPGQLTSLTNLNTLNIAECRLAAWAKPTFPQNNLKIVYAQQNKISYITTAMLIDFHNLSAIYLDENPFSCDCSLKPVSDWIIENNARIFEDPERFVAKCIFPEQWRKQYISSYLKNESSSCESSKDQINEIVIISMTSLISLFFIILIVCCLYKNLYGSKMYNVKY